MTDEPVAKGCAGSEAFLARVHRQLGMESGDPELTGSKELTRGRTVADELADRLGVDASAWRAARRSDSGERAVAAYVLRPLLRYSHGASVPEREQRGPRRATRHGLAVARGVA